MISEFVGRRVEKFENILETIPRVERTAYVNELLLQQRPVPLALPRQVLAHAMDSRERALSSREPVKTSSATPHNRNFSTPSHFCGDDARTMLIAQRKMEKRALANVKNCGIVNSAGSCRKLPW